MYKPVRFTAVNFAAILVLAACGTTRDAGVDALPACPPLDAAGGVHCNSFDDTGVCSYDGAPCERDVDAGTPRIRRPQFRGRR